MIDQPLEAPIVAPRFVPLAQRFMIRGLDLRDMSAVMQVRLCKNGGGVVLQLNLVGPAAAQGLVFVEIVEGSVYALELRAEQAAMATMPTSGEMGDDVELVYDIVMKKTGKPAFIFARGAFIVQAGVTEVVL